MSLLWEVTRTHIKFAGSRRWAGLRGDGVGVLQRFSLPVTLSWEVSAWAFPSEVTPGYVGLVPPCNFLVAATRQRRGHWLH